MAKILIIDDDPDCVDMIAYLLKAAGHTIFNTYSAEKGLIVAAYEYPDLIICSLYMRGIGGFDFIKQLKMDEKLSTIPLIAMTANIVPGDNKKALAEGFGSYITKPIDLDGFLREVQANLDSAKNERFELGIKKKLLLIDNLEEDCTYLSAVLRKYFEIKTVVDAKEALLILKQEKFDLIISDINMPDVSGIDLVKAIRADLKLRTIPIFLMTASQLTKDEIALFHVYGADKCLSKPIEGSLLLEEIHSFFKARKELTSFQ